MQLQQRSARPLALAEDLAVANEDVEEARLAEDIEEARVKLQPFDHSAQHQHRRRVSPEHVEVLCEPVQVLQGETLPRSSSGVSFCTFVPVKQVNWGAPPQR